MKKVLSFGVLLLLAAGVVFAGGQKASSGPEATGAFDWKRASGKSITVYLVEHYATAEMTKRLADFEAATGIKANVQVTPETNYFDQVSSGLASRSGTPDVFMSGIYQLWGYSPAGYVEPLDKYIDSSSLTSPDYDKADFVQSTLNTLRWSGKTGEAMGTGNLLALPISTEIYSMAYNKRAFQKVGITKVPETYDELLAACDKLKDWNGPGSYAIALRGIRDWGTIHPGYLSFYAQFGAKDFSNNGGKLVSQVNSPESIAMNEFFVELVKRGGSPQWSSASWMTCIADLGAGKAAMEIDADAGTIQANLQDTKEKGNIAYAPIPRAKPGDPMKSNTWVWTFAMNSASKSKEAAWLFMQYFTSKAFLKTATIDGGNMDPVRTSVWNDPAFKSKYGAYEGFIETFQKVSPGAAVFFTPHPSFMEYTTDWAAALQDMVAGRTTVKAGLDALKQRMDRAVAE